MNSETFMQLVDHLPYGVYITKPDRTIVFWNQGAEKITGYSREEMIGKKCPETHMHHLDDHGTPLCETYCPLLTTFENGDPRSKKVVFTHKEGHLVVVNAHFIPLRNEEGKLELVAETFEMMHAIDRDTPIVKNLYKMAYHDSLTGLPNRTYLESLLKLRFSGLRRLQYPFALLFADIDHFHEFNEIHGHILGDKMLKEFARVMTLYSRRDDTIGRWGGEEFIGVYMIKRPRDIFPISRRFQEIVKTISIPKGNNEFLSVTFSVGITVAKPEDTPESLIGRADRYMLQAKEAGRNCVVTDTFEN